MRNAAAHFDDDFAIEAPARKRAASRAASSKSSAKRKKKGKSRFSFAFDMHKVARYAAIGMSATVAIGIMVNALMMQKGRHPAPLFGKSTEVAETIPVPPAKPSPAKSEPAKIAAPAVPTPSEAKADSTQSDAAPTKTDMIGRLIQKGAVPTDRADQKIVLETQRALVKLGFALKPTGTLGPQTKKAIERFEKDHHLPVKGELSRRTLKSLAAASGLKIEH